MEENIKAMERKLESYTKKQDSQNKHIEDVLAKMMQAVTELQNQRRDGEGTSRNSTEVIRQNQEQGTNTRPLNFMPKLEFPKFDGSNSRIWIKKCNKYFDLCKIPNDQKVDLASLYMVDKAENWIASYLSVRRSVDWNDFIIDLTARFRDDSGINIVEQFNKLQQYDTLEKYIDEFEDLRSSMIQSSHVLPEQYILDSFVGGVKGIC